MNPAMLTRKHLIEHELVCPACGSATLPVHPPKCSRCGWTGEVADLVRSGKTRERQFPVGKFPVGVPFLSGVNRE